MFTATDALTRPPHRILVAGVSGAGKTTLAVRIAAITGSRHTEIDALYHGPNWTPRDSFLHDVTAFTDAPAWVTEWQYPSARELLAERADTVIWLDLPTSVSLLRVVTRTLRRRRERTVLWNGNREPSLHTVLVNRDHIIRWMLRTRHSLKTLVPAAAREHPHLQVVRLRSQRQVEIWLRRLASAPAP